MHITQEIQFCDLIKQRSVKPSPASSSSSFACKAHQLSTYYYTVTWSECGHLAWYPSPLVTLLKGLGTANYVVDYPFKTTIELFTATLAFCSDQHLYPQLPSNMDDIISSRIYTTLVIVDVYSTGTNIIVQHCQMLESKLGTNVAATCLAIPQVLPHLSSR